MLGINRKYKKKNWRKIFVDKIETVHEQNLQNQLEDERNEYAGLKDLSIASKFISDMVENKILNDMKAKENALKAKPTLETLKPPKPHQQWDQSWGSQMLCHICRLPGISDCVVCQKCNILAHTQCIEFSLLDLGESKITYAQFLDYHCDSCKESIQADDDYYIAVKQELEAAQRREFSARKIAKRIVIMLERNKLARKKRAVIKLQAAGRRLIQQSKFSFWKRAQMRLAIVDLTRLPAPAIRNGVIVLTVFDTYKNTQSFRLDKTAEEALREKFMIPGLTANMTIVLTLAKDVDFHDGTKRYYMYAQAQLNLRDMRHYDRCKGFSLNFVEKITWPPQEFKGEFRFHLVPLANITATNGVIGSSALGSVPSVSIQASAAAAAINRGDVGGVAALVSAVNAAQAAAIAAFLEAGFMEDAASAAVGGGDGGDTPSIASLGSIRSRSTRSAAAMRVRDSFSASLTNNNPNIGGGGGAGRGVGGGGSTVQGQTSSRISKGGALDMRSSTHDCSQADYDRDLDENDNLDELSVSTEGSGGGGERGLGGGAPLGQLYNNSISNMPLDVTSTVTHSSSSTAAAPFCTPVHWDKECHLIYQPQNPVTTMVTMVFAPPLDILKRSAELGYKHSRGAGAASLSRNSRYWLCLYQMKLLLFQYFGDTSPRLIGDVSEASATHIMEKGKKTTTVSITHGDGMRQWLVEFHSHAEANRFVFAVNESRRGHAEGRSRYCKPEDLIIPETPIYTTFGFTTNAVY